MNARTTLAMATPRIPAPAHWAKVDGPRLPLLINVVVKLPEGRVYYCRQYLSTLDAYDDALRTYPDCIGIDAEPVKAAATPAAGVHQ